MKKMMQLSIILMLIAGLIGTAVAQDTMITAKIDQVITKLDKNGNEYTRLMFTDNRELNGIKYQTTAPIMCFGEINKQAKTLKAGDTVKMIVKSQQYNGSTSYVALAVVK